jgi:gliding motility-associated-like protein
MVSNGFGGRLWYQPSNFIAGEYSIYYKCSEGESLSGWGDYYYGAIKPEGALASDHPKSIENISNVSYCSASRLVSAINSEGQGYIWGGGFSNTPIKVVDSVMHCDAGSSIVVFVKSNGTVWSVGNNFSGSFGNGFRGELGGKFISNPIQMEGVQNAVRAVNGYYTTLVLLSNGKVQSVGWNKGYSLGYKSNSSHQLIAKEIPTLSDIVDVKAFGATFIALDKYGNVYSWGENSTKIPSLISKLKNIVAISASNNGSHALALDSSGKCYSWGSNYGGQLGTGELNSNHVDTIYYLTNGVKDISAGGQFSLIVKNDNSLWLTGKSLNARDSGSLFLDSNIRSSKHLIRLNINEPSYELCPTKQILAERTMSICNGDSIKIGKKFYSRDEVVYDTISLSSQLDSITKTNLVIKEFSCSEALKIHTPNAFSPNNDGINDKFGPILNSSQELIQLLIYNRWGELLYKSNKPWDGMQRGSYVPKGTYSYQFKVSTDQQDKRIITFSSGILHVL